MGLQVDLVGPGGVGMVGEASEFAGRGGQIQGEWHVCWEGRWDQGA